MKGSVKNLVMVAFLILCVGLVPVIALPLPYEGLDWLSYGGEIYYGDIYEPDDTRAQARPYSFSGGSQFHTFHVAGDVDWVWFSTQAGVSYVIQTHASSVGSSADTVINLYDANGDWVAGDDDGGVGSDSRLQFRATYTGIYYVRVQEYWEYFGDAYWYYLNIARQSRIYLPILRRGR